ncbi:hypothetical protein [Promicromonospora soli]
MSGLVLVPRLTQNIDECSAVERSSMCPTSIGPLRKGVHRRAIVESRKLARHVRAQTEPLPVRILTTCVVAVRVDCHVKRLSPDPDIAQDCAGGSATRLTGSRCHVRGQGGV